MERFYLWPEQPGASLFALWFFSQLMFWAGRVPMHRAFRSMGRVLFGGLRIAARWLKSVSVSIAKRDREMVMEMGRGDAEGKIAREFRRIESSFAKELNRYPKLHRKIDDLTSRLESDYGECGSAPPAPPGWAEATAAVAKMPENGDGMVKKVLEEIHKSAQAGEKKALQEYRESTANRHKILNGMASMWREVQALAGEAGKSVAAALDSTKRIDSYMASYEQTRKGDEKAVRAMGWQSTQLFVVSVIVLGVAIGGAFVNFNLIALPMSELVPSGNRIGGIPVSTVAALGRIILFVSLGGLLLLACIESSLAILREQIVESSSALKHSLAGISEKSVSDPIFSRIPVVGQAVLGFILPWILAMVAVPLETLISTGGHIVLTVTAGTLAVLSIAMRVLAHGGRYLVETLRHVYDIYIILPLQLERLATGGRGATPLREPAKQQARR